MNYSMLVVLLAVLVVITNIIVQVIKDVSSLSKKPTKMVTVFVAMVITVCSCFAYFQYSGVTNIPWYFIFAFFIAGFVVAYGAMFGFDHLYGELLDRLKEILSKKK